MAICASPLEEYYSLDNPIIPNSIIYYDNTLIQRVQTGYYSTSVDGTGFAYRIINGVVQNTLNCATDPNCGAPPPPNYYTAQKYGCPNTGYGCNYGVLEDVIVVTTGTLVTGKWYGANQAPYDYVYLVTGTTTPSSPATQVNPLSEKSTCTSICSAV